MSERILVDIVLDSESDIPFFIQTKSQSFNVDQPIVLCVPVFNAYDQEWCPLAHRVLQIDSDTPITSLLERLTILDPLMGNSKNTGTGTFRFRER